MAKNVLIKRNHSLLPKNVKKYPFGLLTAKCHYIYRHTEQNET